MAFKSRRPPQSTTAAEEEFLSRADQPAVALKATAPDPDAKPTIAFNLRLNQHQHDLLSNAAKRNRRSMQQEAMAILMHALSSKPDPH